MKNITYSLTLSLIVIHVCLSQRDTYVSFRLIRMAYYETIFFYFHSPCPYTVLHSLACRFISKHFWKAKHSIFLKAHSSFHILLRCPVELWKLKVVSSVSSEKREKLKKSIENLSRSFVRIRAQSLALLRLLSWPRQDPSVTMWPLLKLVNGMQARLKLPLAFLVCL